MIDTAVELRDVFCVHRSNEGDAAALQGMSLTLGAGELLCVIGPSGAGKSTLLRVIAGLQLPQAGIVDVLGRDVGRLPDRARARLRHEQLGFLGQHPEAALAPDMTARAAVALPLALRGVPRRARCARAEELLEAAGLSRMAEAVPAELSGGERQRLALCLALAHRPALLLADEPTGELDKAGATNVGRLIAELVRSQGASAIVVSHDPEAAVIADRTIQVRDGRVVEEHRDGERALVVDRGGWLRIPDELLAEAGIEARARLRSAPGGLVLTASGVTGPGRPAPIVTAAAPVARFESARVDVRSVARSYRQGRAQRRVVEGLTWAFASGRVTVVCGPSGAGKTTLLRLLAGLERPDSGDVLIDDEPLGQLGAEQLAAIRRSRIGYLPQQPTPVGFLSASENVILALRVRGWDPRAATARAALALSRVGLDERALQTVSRLSAGEGQRVALARALASARGLLIVDEPTSRLDEANARSVARLLAAAADEGQTVICATHDPVLVNRADEVLELRTAR